MKNSNYFINSILIVTTIVLFTQCNGQKTNSDHSAGAGATSDSTGVRLPIAYVRIDSLLAHYKFFNDLNDAYMKKVEDKKLILNQRAQKFQKDVIDFNQKMQNNAFISQERASQEQSRLAGVQEELQNYSAQVDSEMAQERAKMVLQVQDTIIVSLKQYNKPKKYEFIFSNSGTDNILYADDAYDITKDVTDFLNTRYTPSK
jgi:outer membrane protein